MLDAAGFLDRPAAVANFPFPIDFDQVNRVRAAMGKHPIDVEVIGRLEDGDVIRDEHSRVPKAFREFFRPPVRRIQIVGLRPGA